MPGRVLRLDLEYDGAGFSGWAAQPGLRTVEGELRRALGTLLRGPFELAVAGRTDAGVHASGQVASVATGSDLEPRRVLAALAALLPDDLSARAVSEAPPGFDARRDARARRYEYRVLPGPPSALRRGRVLVHPAPARPRRPGRRRAPGGGAARLPRLHADPHRARLLRPHRHGLRLGRARRRAGADRRGRRLPAPHGARAGWAPCCWSDGARGRRRGSTRCCVGPRAAPPDRPPRPTG